jgi:hypothetical protein
MKTYCKEIFADISGPFRYGKRRNTQPAGETTPNEAAISISKRIHATDAKFDLALDSRANWCQAWC